MTDKATQIIADAMRSTGCYEHVNIEDHAQTIRAALAAARIELIELPEPAHGPDGGGQYEWQPTASTVTATPNDTGSWSIWDEDNEMSPDEAHELAAALLAAAHTAEAQHTAQER